MTDEQKGDNKPKEPADNKATEVKPNFPDIDKGQVNKEKVETPQDPDLQKWIEETKDLPNAYKRVKGAQTEVEKYRKQLDDIQKEQELFQKQLAQELQAVYQKDPETAAKLFGINPQGKPVEPEPQKASVDPQEIARQVQANMEVQNFHGKNQQYIADQNDWNAIQDLALGFVGKVDRKGNPYTIQTALTDALILRHPELIADKAIMDHLSSQAKRASATESGDMTGSSAAGDIEISDEEIAIAKEMGVDPERLRKRRQRAQSTS